jgi:hypothetical protein
VLYIYKTKGRLYLLKLCSSGENTVLKQHHELDMAVAFKVRGTGFDVEELAVNFEVV